MDNKEKMSRTLGAAFLSHQVAQLEKSVNNGNRMDYSRAAGGRGNNRNNVRGGGMIRGGRGGGRGGRSDVGGIKRSEDTADTRAAKADNRKPIVQEKVADRIVVDASVLIHALGRVRTWCRDSNREVIIVPLEALNTLDLLKKGTTRLAIRARSASRLLEEQVGTNPRILVQQDHGYIPWESAFATGGAPVNNRLSTDSENTILSSTDDESNSGSAATLGVRPISLAAVKRSAEPPEWLKRTICCAKYEQERPRDALDGGNLSDKVKTVIAISTVPSSAQPENRYENRASGTFTRLWSVNAGLEVLDVDADDADNMPRVGDLTISEPTTHRRKHSGEKQSPRKSSFDKSGHRGGRRPSASGGNLVEKPTAPIPLTNAGLLPAGKVIRLLARGEKLEP